MAKPRNFDDIIFNRHGVKPLETPLGLDKKILAFDTETYKGKVTLIASSNSKYALIEDFGDLLNFMGRSNLRKSINFFFNLEYDTNAILKLLPDENLYHLIEFNRTVYNGYELQIIPRKLLSIKHNRNTIRFFDIYQFYQLGSLEKTFNITFNCSQIKCPIDENYNKVECRNCPNYLTAKNKENYFIKALDASKEFPLNDISEEDIKYCIDDTIATYKLSEYFVNLCNQIVYIDEFYSPASLGKAVMRKHLTEEYIYKPDKIGQYALYNFNGGRFETMLRGEIGDNSNYDYCYMYDINSAYPYQIANLKGLEGFYSYQPEYRPESIYSYFLCHVTIPFRYITPLKYFLEDKGLLVYPHGKLQKVYLNKSEYELLMDFDCKVYIKKAVHLMNNEDITYPFKYFSDLYNLRRKLKEENNPLQLPLKLSSNAAYGSMVQLTEKVKLYKTDDIEKLDDLLQDFNCDIVDMENQTYVKIKNHYSGMFFNPIYATEITANTRCKLYRDSIDYEDNIIMFATDSITQTCKNKKIKISNKLGEYSDTKKLEGLIMGSGIYSLTEKENKKKRKIRFRGFGYYDILKIAQENPQGQNYQIKKNAPFKLKESKKDLSKINVFGEKIKNLDFNFDKKRLWDKEVKTFKDLLGQTISSKPISI